MVVRPETTLPTPRQDPASVRRITKSILQRGEFKPARRSLLQAALHWLSTQLGRLLGNVFGAGAGASGWLATGAVALLALVVGLLAWLTYRHLARIRVDRWSPAFVVVGRDRGRSPADWRAAAAAHEAAGRWRDALRCRYRALVAELAGRGILDEVPGRTSGEYTAAFTVAVAGAAPAFSRASALFEQAWYGDRPTGADDQVVFDELAGRVLAGTA